VLFSFVGIGLLLGFKHALEADHIAAVSTFVTQTKSLKKASYAGVLWGLGHTLTLLVVGGIVLVLKISVPEKVALGLELPVAIILVVLGARLIIKARQEKIHLHTHAHDGQKHTHLHTHANNTSHNHAHQSFFMGMLHGLAGSSALVLLVLGATSSTVTGLTFILVFGIGSVLGMLGLSMLVGLPFLLSSKFESLDYFLKLAAGSVSCLVGTIVIYELIFVEKIFQLAN